MPYLNISCQEKKISIKTIDLLVAFSLSPLAHRLPFPFSLKS